MLFRYGTCEITSVNDKSQFPFKLICQALQTSVQKLLLQFKFVHPCLFLYLLCYLYRLTFFLALLNLVAVFDKFRDTAPLIITGVSVK